MPTTDAADFLRRSLAAMATADYDAWHATERLVLADALEELGDGRCAWLRGLKDVEPVYDLPTAFVDPVGQTVDATVVQMLTLKAIDEDVEATLLEGRRDASPPVRVQRWQVWVVRPSAKHAKLGVRCSNFGTVQATLSLRRPLLSVSVNDFVALPDFSDGVHSGLFCLSLDRQLAITQRRNEILATLTSPKP